MEIFLVGTERTEDKYGAKLKRAMRAGRRPGKAARYSFSTFVCREHDFARHVHLERGLERTRLRLHLTTHETWINNASDDPELAFKAFSTSDHQLLPHPLS
jgi:hypothetical protein